MYLWWTSVMVFFFTAFLQYYYLLQVPRSISVRKSIWLISFKQVFTWLPSHMKPILLLLQNSIQFSDPSDWNASRNVIHNIFVAYADSSHTANMTSHFPTCIPTYPVAIAQTWYTAINFCFVLWSIALRWVVFKPQSCSLQQ